MADDHNMCCKEACVLCYEKGNRSISDKEVDYVRSFVIEGYDVANQNSPSSLCEPCHFIIQHAREGKPGKLPSVESYDPLRPILLCGQACTCKIYEVAKRNIFPRRKKKKVAGRPTIKTPEMSPQDIKVCFQCF